MRVVRIVTLVVALGLFAHACVSPAAYGRGGFLEGGTAPPGWLLVLFGGFLCFVSPLGFAWLANPIGAIAAHHFWHRRWGVAALYSLLAVLLSLIPLTYMVLTRATVVLRLEAPVALTFPPGNLELRIGYFTWVASHLTLFAGAAVAWSVALLAEPPEVPPLDITRPTPPSQAQGIRTAG